MMKTDSLRPGRARVGLFALLVAGVLLCAASSALAENEVASASKIDRVTVYADRALVTRVADVKLERGKNVVELDDFPTTLAPDSIRVSGESSKAVTILSIKNEIVRLAEIDDAAVKALKAELEKLAAKDKELVDELNVLKEEFAFYTSIRIDPSVAIPEGEKAETSSAEDWAAIVDFVRGGMESIVKRQREIEDGRTELSRDISVVRDKLRVASAGKRAEKNVIRVGLDASAATSITLSVSYVMMGATWNASYDVRLDSAKMAVELKFDGIVTQATGEDWKDAKVTLSTAAPQIDQSMPELTRLAYARVRTEELAKLAENLKRLEAKSVRLDDAHADKRARKESKFADELQAEKAEKDASRGYADDKNADADFYDEEAEYAGVAFGAEPAERPGRSGSFGGRLGGRRNLSGGLADGTIAPALAKLNAILAAGAADFDVAGRETIPSDNSPHKITVAIKEFTRGDVAYHYRATPLLLEKAFLFGEMTNSADYPLLPGAMNLFVDASFVGRGILPGAVSGEKFTLSLGVDEGIRVERKRLKKEVDADKRFSGRTKVEYAYELKIENYKSFPVDMRVYDRIPTCDNKDVSIEVGRVKPGISDEEREDGVLEWRIPVASGATEKITFEYSVRHPNSLEIGGLE